ncbi:MAG: DUF6209 family protein [Archangium sp.]|nr:DUF6209 family protein [Archangium sp.]
MKNLHWLALVVLSGCGVQDAFVDEGELADFESVVDAPLLGANGKDAAERSCQIVLRSLDRGATSCTNGICWWTWTGLIDISKQAEAEGARARVLFKNIDATPWSSVSTTRTTGAPAGFTRYRFRLTRDTLRDGMSATAYARANVQVAPYLMTTTGARLFDHNRVPGELDAYVLSQAGGWRVAPDAAVCNGDVVASRTLDFQSGYRITQRGTLVAGQPVTLNYALDRLTTCRGTHNGFPAWELQASVRFFPSGSVAEGTVRGFDAPNGVPSNAGAKSVPLEVNIPSGTTSMEVWFRNSSGAGMNCEAWDSNNGSNYRFPVFAAAPARVQWVGNAGSSFTRACARQDGVPASTTLDSYVQQRACMFVEVDVYVPGLTDSGETQPGAVFAQAELKLDGVAMAGSDLTFVGRFGNDYRFHFEVPKSELYYGPKWQKLEYGFRFSTDGRVWLRETTRVVTRDVSFCNPAWPGGC